MEHRTKKKSIKNDATEKYFNTRLLFSFLGAVFSTTVFFNFKKLLNSERNLKPLLTSKLAVVLNECRGLT